MRDLVMRFLNDGLSRRGFLKKMAAAGFSTVAAKAVLESLSPLTAVGAELATAAGCRLPTHQLQRRTRSREPQQQSRPVRNREWPRLRMVRCERVEGRPGIHAQRQVDCAGWLQS